MHSRSPISCRTIRRVIVYSTTPAVLALIDGHPVLRPSADNMQKVINTRALILFDRGRSMYYLALMDGWVEAPAVEGPWNPAKHEPTKELDKIRQGAETTNSEPALGQSAAIVEGRRQRTGVAGNLCQHSSGRAAGRRRASRSSLRFPAQLLQYVSNTGCDIIQ